MDIWTIALDPGVTTGYSIGRITSGQFQLTCNQSKLSHLDLYDLVRQVQPAYLICESFEFRGRSRDNVELFSRELIGIAKLLEQEKRTILELQTAAEGKGNFSDDKLKALNLYSTKKHGRDAVRHQLHWFTFKAGFQFNKNQSIRLVEEIVDGT